MRLARLLAGAVLALVLVVVPAVVLADGRVALVVGNSTYAHIGRLPNSDNPHLTVPPRRSRGVRSSRPGPPPTGAPAPRSGAGWPGLVGWCVAGTSGRWAGGLCSTGRAGGAVMATA